MVKFRVVIRNQPGQEDKDGLYNVKIRVTHQRKTRYIGTDFRIREDQIDHTGTIINHDLAGEYNIKLRNILNLYEKKILDYPGNVKMISMRELIQYLRQIDTDGRDQDYYLHHEKYIRDLRKQGRDSYADSHETSLNAIKKFHPGETLEFAEITPEWLKSFRQYLVGKGRMNNTVAIYQRNIRTVYNDAVQKKLVSRDLYPFYDYKIKQEKTRKRSLSIEDIRKIRDVKLEKENERRARDLFMLSFYMNGINFKDLLLARQEDIYQGRYIFNRAKTGRSYSIKIFPQAQQIIDQYPGREYLLDFIEKKELAIKKKGRAVPLYKDVVDWTNKKLKDIAKHDDVKLGVPLSTYYARHSLATIARNIGIPKDDIRSLLGHGENEITDIYIELDIERIDTAMRMVLEELEKDVF